MLFKKCFGSIILRFAQIYEGGIYYLALTYFLKNSNNFLTDTRKYYEKKVNLLSCKLQSSNSSCILHLQWKVSIYWKTWRLDLAAKGQIKPIADCRAVDSPKKRTNERIWFFAFLTFMAKKANSFVRFLGESTAWKSAYCFIWPLASLM